MNAGDLYYIEELIVNVYRELFDLSAKYTLSAPVMT